MAVAQLNLSRRALLGAAFAAPVLGAVVDAVPGGGGQGHVQARHPGLGPGSSWMAAVPVDNWTPDQVRGDEAKWSRAKARYQAAQAALAALAHTSDEARYDRAGARCDATLQRLLRTNAPHAAALADKIDLLIAHLAWELTAGDLCLAAIRADARRLAAPPFVSPQLRGGDAQAMI